MQYAIKEKAQLLPRDMAPEPLQTENTGDASSHPDRTFLGSQGRTIISSVSIGKCCNINAELLNLSCDVQETCGHDFVSLGPNVGPLARTRRHNAISKRQRCRVISRKNGIL